MGGKQFRKYGSWKSPITSDLIVAGTISLGEIQIEGGDVFWIESRPAEAGRNVLVRRAKDGAVTDITPTPLNVRTRVHEYGGGAYTVRGGDVYFSNYRDQRLYHRSDGAVPRPLTPEGDMRYADAVFDPPRNRLICVLEDHRSPGEPVNSLAEVRVEGDCRPRVIVSGNDFYSSPRISPDGNTLAWLTWRHPNMPWDGTELWTAELTPQGSIAKSRMVAGGLAESVFQPEWSPDGVLYFVSDRTGWWNLYRERGGQIEPVSQMEVEFGAPQWIFGMSTYSFESARRIVCTYNDRGLWRLAVIDTTTRKLEPIETPLTEIKYLRASAGRVYFCGGSPTEPLSVYTLDLESGLFDVLRRSSSLQVPSGYLSRPRPVEFGTERGLTAHAFFYTTRNDGCSAEPGERPPLIVISHGGPTSSATTTLNLGIQYWTSRGIAVLDVDYGGSTGYGRAYRERLNGQWGIVDVDDCVNGARFLAERGEVDGDRLIIRGGSAGGYTTLAALTFRDIFKAGASYYGVSDLEVLEKEGHKFESKYSTSLIGPYPERRDLYRARSPIHFVDRLSCPIILFQGLEDKVVPPNQAEMMFSALRSKGVPVAYLPFEGEQHGFRRAENIKRALDAELYFYSRVFGFELADPVEPVNIENL